MPSSVLSSSILPQDIFPSPGLFTLFCWPFLVTWLLWISARANRAREMAFVGAGLSFVALLGFSENLYLSEAISLALEACVPILLFMPLRACGEGVGRLGGSEGERLPFLVVGCIFWGFCLRSTFPIIIIVGAGSVLLAWWDGRAIRRAMPAWIMARLRLCGVILSSLGTALLHGTPSIVTPASSQTLGVVLLVIGLAMMAGLGSAATAAPELDLLDVGLRFASLTVMVHLAHYPLAHRLMVFSGLIALFMTMLGRKKTFPLLPCLTALGALAAASGQMVALLLLQAAALLGTSLRLSVSLESSKESTLPERTVLPVIIVVLLQLGHVLPLSLFAVVLCCLSFGMKKMRLAPPLMQGWSFWVGHNMHTRILVCILMVITLMGVFASSWNILPGWQL